MYLSRSVYSFFMRGIINIGIGAVFIVGGLSGKMALRGTQSGPGLAVVGGFLILLGIYRLARPSD
jgi:hypothetical protein